MGALVERELKPKHKRTMGINEAGTDIEDPEEFCLTFGEHEEDFVKLKAMLNVATDEEKTRLYALLGCNQVGEATVFNTRGDLSQHMSRLTEEDYGRIVTGLKTQFNLDITASEEEE